MPVQYTSKPDELLCQLARFQLLTAELAALSLDNAPSMFGKVRRLLSQLKTAGLIDSIPVHFSATGRPKALYFPTAKGYSRACELLAVPKDRYKPSEVKEQSYGSLVHPVEANRVLLSLRQLGKMVPAISVHRDQTEYECRRRPVTTTLADYSTAKISVDGFAELAIVRDGKTYGFPIVVEYDRNSESEAAWKRKIQKFVSWYGHDYEAAFQTNHCTYAIVCPNNESRLSRLMQWTDEELTRWAGLKQANRFHFTSADVSSISPAEFWLGNHWLRLNHPTPTRLSKILPAVPDKPMTARVVRMPQPRLTRPQPEAQRSPRANPLRDVERLLFGVKE